MAIHETPPNSLLTLPRGTDGSQAVDATEQRIYDACWQDGSLDLVAGLAAALIGVAWLRGHVVVSLFAPALAVPAWVFLRRSLIEARLGRVQFGRPRRRRIRRGQVGILLVGCGLLALFVGLVVARDGLALVDWLSAGVAALPAALLGLLAVLCAVTLGIPRFAFHGLAFAAAGAGILALDLDPGWAILAGGAITAGVGLGLLVAFLRRFPRLSNELE